MLIDLIFAVILVLAILKGYQRGLVIGLFSLVAVIIGLAAAMKLSTVVAGYIGKAVKVSEEWLPIISFAVVFLINSPGGQSYRKSDRSCAAWLGEQNRRYYSVYCYLYYCFQCVTFLCRANEVASSGYN